jgi:AraC-like DNA-binding protein
VSTATSLGVPDSCGCLQPSPFWRAESLLHGPAAVVRLGWNEVAAELDRFRQLRPAPSQGISRQVRKLLECIHTNLFDPNVSVKTLKARCGLRDNNVSCRFRCETGIYLHAYIAALRLEAATILLRRPELTVIEIAQLVGYYHLQTFYRAFKGRFRCTPAAFRRRAGGPVRVARLEGSELRAVR